MSSELAGFERFRDEVLADPGLQQQLRLTTDRESFIELLVALGSERGYRFTGPVVEEALRAAQKTWIERWID